MRQLLYSYSQVLGLLKILFYKIVYGKGLRLSGFPHNSYRATIRIRKGGVVSLAKGSHLSEHNYLWVTENAVFQLGNNSGFGVNSVISCREKIIIGNNVMTGPFVCLYDNDHTYKTDGLMMYKGYETAPIIIEDNVWIGSHVRILRGVTIGEGSVIAAGSTVNKDVPPNSIFYNKKNDVIKSKF